MEYDLGLFIKVIGNLKDKEQRNNAIKNIFATRAFENDAKDIEDNDKMRKNYIGEMQESILKMIDNQDFLVQIISDYNSSLTTETIGNYLLKVEDSKIRNELLKKAIKERTADEVIEVIIESDLSKYYESEKILNESLREKSKQEFLSDENKYKQNFRESVFNKNRSELKFIASAITIYNNSKDSRIKEKVWDIFSTYIKSETDADKEVISKFTQKLFNNEINICRLHALEAENQIEFANITGEVFDKKQLKTVDIKSLNVKKIQECLEKIDSSNNGKNIKAMSRLAPMMKLYNLELAKNSKKRDTSKIGTMDNIQFGMELEFKGLRYDEFEIYLNTILEDERLQNDIGLTKEEKNIIKNLKDWNSVEDVTVYRGTEFKSDILKDSENTWQEISTISKIIESIDGYTDEECAFHIHIDAGILGIDSKAWEMFYKIQQINEEVIKKISCPIGEKNKTDNDIFAKDIKNDEIITGVGVRIESEKDLVEFAKQASRYQNENGRNSNERFDREKRINIMGIVRGDKYTIEDRGANGVTDYEDIRNGCIKSIRIAELAKRISKDKNFESRNQQKIHDMLYAKSERIRAKALIELAFRENEQKEYFDRYENYPDSRNDDEKEK